MQNFERTESGIGGFDTQWYGNNPTGGEAYGQDFTVPGTSYPPQGYEVNDPYGGGFAAPPGYVPQGGYSDPNYGAPPAGYGAPPQAYSGYSNAPYGAPGGPGDFNSYFMNPDLINSVASSPLASIAGSYAGNLLNQSRIESTLQRWIFDYKYYFNVNNFYVMNKTKLILFPLNHKSWSRRIVKQGDIEGYLPPREDINAPDLYIPMMAAITFIILHGFVMGTANKFTPEVLGRTATTSFFSIMFEVLFIKFGFYLLSSIAVPVSFLDLVAYTGYIFVGITVNSAVGIIGGRIPYYVSVLITSLFMAIFMVKTFRILLLDRGGYDSSGMTNMRNYFIFAIAVLQPLIAFFLGVVV